MGNPTYFLTLVGILIVALVVRKLYQLQIFLNLKHFLFYTVIIFLVGSIWDYFSVSHQIWVFPEGGTLGLRLGVLPIEEFLFFLIIPYFGLVVYRVFEKIKLGEDTF